MLGSVASGAKSQRTTMAALLLSNSGPEMVNSKKGLAGVCDRPGHGPNSKMSGQTVHDILFKETELETNFKATKF